MARNHLTLAALATSAVPGLDVVQSARFGSQGSGDFDAAILTLRDGNHAIVRVPRSARAEQEQQSDLEALRALSAGIRTRLPFAVSTPLGQAPVGRTRAVVTDFVYGARVRLDRLTPQLAESIGRAIAAIHGLPTSFITDAGLPAMTAVECLRSSVSVMDRAAATGFVPTALVARWSEATEDPRLWQFQPTVINGALAATTVLAADDAVTGVLGWHELRVGDPARDLYWVLGARNPDVTDLTFEAYSGVRGGVDRHVAQRARLYSELEIARWLLHGTELKSEEIVDDAVQMMHALVDRVDGAVDEAIATPTLPVSTVTDVHEVLARAERAV